MSISKRFDNAVEKLYKAFHNEELNPECCNHCAVGSICDNFDGWKHFTDVHGSSKLNYIGIVNENLGRRINGYRPSELLQIEVAFLKGCGYSLPFTPGSRRPGNTKDMDTLFQGLCGAVACLCELENIPDIMDCTVMFDFVPSEHNSNKQLLPN